MIRQNRDTLLILSILILFIARGCYNPSIEIFVPTTPEKTSVIPTVTNSPMPTKTAEPTETSLPSITVDTAAQVMSKFLMENGGCKLPCLLGLTPGLSSQASIDAFIGYFRNNTIETEYLSLGTFTHEHSGSVYIIFQSGQERVYPLVSYYYDEGRLSTVTLSSETTLLSNGMIVYDTPYGIELMEYYSLSNILTNYGIPSDVLIASFPTDPNRPLDRYTFSLVLYYEDRGFLVEYISLRQEQGKYWMGCQPTSHINLVSWIPQGQQSLLDNIAHIGGEGINTLNIDYFQRLPDATSLTISDFYDMFRSQGGSNCVVTPKKLWPEPVLTPPPH